MKVKHFLSVMAKTAFFVVVLIGTVTAASIAQSSHPLITQLPSNLNQNHSLLCSYQPNPDNLDSQYQEQNDSEREETINESDAENTEEDKEIESGNEKEEVETDDQQDDIPSGNAVISADTAKQIAESFLNTGSATKIVLDDENGKLVYSIEIGSSEVKVDALTGAVINTNKQ